MLVYQNNYSKAVRRVLQQRPHYFVEESIKGSEKFLIFEALLEVITEREIDMVERFILKILVLPIAQKKTARLINDMLNVGEVFVTSYINDLTLKKAIKKQGEGYTITTRGEDILESNTIDDEITKLPYKFLYNVESKEVLPFTNTKRLVPIEDTDIFFEKEEFLFLLESVEKVLFRVPQLKTLNQKAYRGELIYKVHVIDSKTLEKVRLSVNMQGEILSEKVTGQWMSPKTSQIEEDYLPTLQQAIPVKAEALSYRIMQAKQEIVLAFKCLKLSDLTLEDINFMRSTGVPLTILYETTETIKSEEVTYTLEQWYTFTTLGIAPISFIEVPISVNYLIIDENSLFYLEENQWYYYATPQEKSREGEQVVTPALIIQQLHLQQDETLWNQLIQRLFLFELTSQEIVKVIMAMSKVKPSYFAHYFKELTIQYQLIDEDVIKAFDYWKSYPSQKKKLGLSRD